MTDKLYLWPALFYIKLYKHKKLNVIDFVDRLVTRNRYYTCLPLYHQNLIRFEGKIVDYVYTIILKQRDIGRHFYEITTIL